MLFLGKFFLVGRCIFFLWFFFLECRCNGYSFSIYYENIRISFIKIVIKVLVLVYVFFKCDRYCEIKLIEFIIKFGDFLGFEG